MKTKGYCFTCNEYVDYSTIKEPVHITTIDGVDVSYECHVGICKKCGDRVSIRKYELEDSIGIADVYKKQVGLLTSAEIKTYRKQLGLTAEKLALNIGLGKKTITRYERGSYQTPQIDKAMREFFAKHLGAHSLEMPWTSVDTENGSLQFRHCFGKTCRTIGADADSGERGNHEKILAVCA